MRIPRSLIRLLTLFLLLNAAFLSASDPGGILKGRAVDSDGRPIQYMYVIISGEGVVAMTDADGRFTASDLRPGRYTIIFDHIGYQVRTLPHVEIIKDMTLDLRTLKFRDKVIRMGETVVTATRTHRLATDVPFSVNLIPEVQIRERNAKTTAEALREETGIFVQKTSHGGGSAIIRGLSSNQILILVDGIRLNNSIYRLGNHPYLTTIDYQMLEQVEVVRGPTSVLFGSDALGGTINTITREPRLEGADLRAGFRLFSRYATADQERIGRVEFNLSHRNVAFHGGISYKLFGDLRRGANSSHPEIENSTNGLLQTPTAHKSLDGDAKLVYRPSNNQTWIAAFQTSHRPEVPRYDKYENNGYHRWFYTPQTRNLLYLRYNRKFPSKWITSLTGTVSYHRQKEGRETQKSPEATITQEADEVQTVGLTLQLNTILEPHLITYGTELYIDHIYSQRWETDPVTSSSNRAERGRYPDNADYRSFGLYIQDEIRLNALWSVTGGVRYSTFDTHFNLSESESPIEELEDYEQMFNSFTGSIGINARLSQHSVWTVNVGQGFRAPNLGDLAKLGESKGTVYEIPNYDLKPERMLDFDTGITIHSGRLHLEAAAYYARALDFLGSVDTTYHGSPTLTRISNGDTITYQIKTKKNIGEARFTGFEIGIRGSILRNFNARLNVSYVYAQNITLNEPVSKVPPLFGLAGIKWFNHRGMEWELYYRFALKQDRLSADDMDDPRIPEHGTPAWSTLNTRFSMPLGSRLNMQVALENIFDINYREHASGVNGPGRNFIVSLDYRY
jgi:hemoglobin/transferrin/lactoferrin receptor protein